MEDEGLARNIRSLFGTGIYQGIDKPIETVSLNADKTQLTISFQDGSKAIFEAEGDCCSSSWIEHLTVPDDIKGATITHVADFMVSQEDHTGDETWGDLLQFYNTKFRTPKGDIILEYRNRSNGYYGGYLIRKDLREEEDVS